MGPSCVTISQNYYPAKANFCLPTMFSKNLLAPTLLDSYQLWKNWQLWALLEFDGLLFFCKLILELVLLWFMWFYEELVLELKLFMQCLMNWYWYWNCLHNDRRIGIGVGIVYIMTEDLVLELFTQSLKNWYCIEIGYAWLEELKTHTLP